MKTMSQLKRDLQIASEKIQKDQQEEGVLLLRKKEYKEKLETSITHLMEGLQHIMTSVKLKKLIMLETKLKITSIK
jgi:hypothetical protein